jgi:glycosyltransferase involved in cell wall biosynthesis
MRILFVTQYYLPETGAPQNRLSGLAREFRSKGVAVTVLTAMPNYPEMKIQAGYRGKFTSTEKINDVTVYRAWIYAGKHRSIFSRLLNYFSFVFTSLLVSFRIRGKYDFVICESPPLFLGLSAFAIARLKKAKFVFNVSDLWPESAEKLGLVSNKFFLRLAYRLEAGLYRKSVLVSGQTQGICQDIRRRFPSVRTHWLPNGIDPGRFRPDMHSDWRMNHGFQPGDFILLYAGIIGHAQGLEVILRAAQSLKENPEIKFVLLGEGPEKGALEKLTVQWELNNVFFFPAIRHTEMPSVIRATDAAIIPLKRLELFKGAIPSKIFESLAMNKPILLGVEGEAKELFIDQGRCGLFFTPGDASDLATKVLQLSGDPERVRAFGRNGRDYVYRFFNREKIAGDFLEVLKELNG